MWNKGTENQLPPGWELRGHLPGLWFLFLLLVCCILMICFQVHLSHQTGSPFRESDWMPGTWKMLLKCLLNGGGVGWEQERLGMTLIPVSPLTKHTCQLLWLYHQLYHKPKPWRRRRENDLVYSVWRTQSSQCPGYLSELHFYFLKKNNKPG